MMKCIKLKSPQEKIRIHLEKSPQSQSRDLVNYKYFKTNKEL